MHYDSMFLAGTLIISVVLLSLALLMSENDLPAVFIIAGMAASVFLLLGFTPTPNMITVGIVLVIIVVGIRLWDLRIQRVRRNRAAQAVKDAQAAKAAQIETIN